MNLKSPQFPSFCFTCYVCPSWLSCFYWSVILGVKGQLLVFYMYKTPEMSPLAGRPAPASLSGRPLWPVMILRVTVATSGAQFDVINARLRCRSETC